MLQYKCFGGKTFACYLEIAICAVLITCCVPHNSLIAKTTFTGTDVACVDASLKGQRRPRSAGARGRSVLKGFHSRQTQRLLSRYCTIRDQMSDCGRYRFVHASQCSLACEGSRGFRRSAFHSFRRMKPSPSHLQPWSASRCSQRDPRRPYLLRVLHG